jgi:hypothetical protein
LGLSLFSSVRSTEKPLAPRPRPPAPIASHHSSTFVPLCYSQLVLVSGRRKGYWDRFQLASWKWLQLLFRVVFDLGTR